jgi:hypothetical protein
MYPYCPFVSFRVSPFHEFPLNGESEFGFAGILCEIFRQHTKRGAWRTMPFTYRSDNGQDVFSDSGAWFFVLDGVVRCGIPQDDVLSFFGLTRETFLLLSETADASNGLSQMFHFLPRARWNASNFQVETYYPKYLADKKRLHH